MKQNKPTVYVGVDISKATLDISIQDRQYTIANNLNDINKFCKELKPLKTAHVICESTGGYERRLTGALHSVDILVSVTNPAQVRASAMAQGQRAKSDKIDSRLLADYGQRYQPQPTPKASEAQRELSELTQWLQQLVEAQAVAKAQAEHHSNPLVLKQHALLIKHLESQIAKVEKQIQNLLLKDSSLSCRIECMQEVEGVGFRTACLIQAHMPELGQLNRQTTAALAGLAPWTRESGNMKGVRCIGGGRPEVRNTLYMAALTAIRHNPILREFYKRLKAKNKPSKVALTAVMRKLIVYLNHKLKALIP